MAYIGKSPAGLGVRARYYYTATGGETSISGADDNGRTLQFTDGEYVDVYLNGVLLVAGTDYGTGTANTISGLDALSAGNIVEIVAYDIFSLGKANTEALRRRYYKTATGGETSISGSDDNGLTITFAANAEIEVYLNGVALVQGDDYNTSAANTVGGLAALDADDIVTIVAYEEFVLGDVVSKKSGGTFGNSISVSGDLTVDTDTLYVDSTNNNVGIGTSSPSVSGNTLTTLNVKGNANNTGLITVTSNDLGSSVQLYSGNSSSDNPAIAFQNDLRFGSATDAGVGGFSERLRILPSGGITFNGDTAAANALDDYEEGTWTPTFTNATGLTFYQNNGVYTKVGNICTFILNVRVDTWTSPDTNYLELTLPFTSHNQGTGYTPAVAFWETGWSYNTQKPQALIYQNQSIVRMLAGNYGVTGNNYTLLRQNNVTAADLWIRIQGTYRVA